MSAILIPCPQCGSGLKLKDRSYLGKVGRCPKCGNRFLLEEPDEIELELADASNPAVGTAARWVPDTDPPEPPSPSPGPPSGFEPEHTGFPIQINTEAPAIQIKTHPTIQEGMTLPEVTALLGKPAKRKRVSDLAAKAKKQGKSLDVPADADRREYMVFQHAAGSYKLTFHDGKVAEIHAQPDPESPAPVVAAVPSRSRRRRKNMVAGIMVGGVLGSALAGFLIYATQVKPPEETVQRPKNKPPEINQAFVADESALADNVAFARRFAEEHFPTQGEPITFERIPAGARIIIHLRPAELWSDEAKFARFRAALTADVTSWLEAAIKKHCLYDPREIEEALICIIPARRSQPPDIATRVKLTRPRKPSEFLMLFGGVSNNEYGYPVYISDERAYLIERDSQTFAVAPAAYAEELVRAQKQVPITETGIQSIVAHTDKERHATVIFQPFDVRMHQEFLVAENVRPALNEFLGWLNVDDVETALWTMHLGDEQFYSQFLFRPNKHADKQWKASMLEGALRKKLEALPKDLYETVQVMSPRRIGFRKIIGRFPAMMKVFSLSTLGGTDDGMAQFTTVLPAKAAPNLALGTMLVWDESTRTDFAKEAPKPPPSEPKLPDLIVDRLKLPMDVDFRQRPLGDAFRDIGEAAHVTFELDGDALKLAAYTQNMPQNFKLGVVPASQAVAKILSQYDKMCVCILDEEKNILLVTTLDGAEQKQLTPMKFN